MNDVMTYRICPNCGGQLNEKGRCMQCKKKPGSILTFPYCIKPFSVLHGKYLIFNVIGEGGFGIIYSAYDITTKKHYAIKEYYPKKFVHRDAGNNLELNNENCKIPMANGLKNFAMEAKQMIDLKDVKFISHTVELFSENNTAYIVMQFAEGITLKKYISSHFFLSVRDLLKMLTTVFISLNSLHTRGIIHCDISPDNIMINNGIGSLIDFGASKKTGDAEIDIRMVVKPGYAPLELYKINSKPTPATDVYSLGATLYFCFFKKAPPKATDDFMFHFAEDRIDRKFRNNPSFATALKKSLSKDPDDRYSNVLDFLQDLSI